MIRKIHRSGVLLVVLFITGTGSLCAGQADPAMVYSIQLGAFDTAREASALVDSLQSASIKAEVRTGGESSPLKPYKVVTGQYETYAAAWTAKGSMPPAAPSDRFITKWPSNSSIAESVPPPSAEVYSTAGLGKATTLSAEDVWAAGGFDAAPEGVDTTINVDTSADSQTARKAAIKSSGKDQTANDALEAALALRPGASDANRNRLALARAYGRGRNPSRAEALLGVVASNGTSAEKAAASFIRAHVLLNKKDLEGAFAAFQAIAGNQTYPEALRRQSMRRAAGVAHSSRDYRRAWTAFSQIESNAATAEEKAEARVQKAGLAFELVCNGKGTWNEVRMLCQRVAEDESAPRTQRATAELMFLETFYYEGNYQETLSKSREFMARYPDIKREYYTAAVWQGIMLLQLRQLPEAKMVFENILAARIARDEMFGQLEPRARAAAWLAYLANDMNDQATKLRALGILRSEFPNSEETKYAKNLFPGFPWN
ncbi:MAG: SPOR domain-containing protein [Candidatus Sumerlaeaceae bacterium]|nr:SPOR domain-containing protein [Candidatus Sumerlaeaceae bacterium]